MAQDPPTPPRHPVAARPVPRTSLLWKTLPAFLLCAAVASLATVRLGAAAGLAIGCIVAAVAAYLVLALCGKSSPICVRRPTTLPPGGTNGGSMLPTLRKPRPWPRP